MQIYLDLVTHYTLNKVKFNNIGHIVWIVMYRARTTEA